MILGKERKKGNNLNTKGEWVCNDRIKFCKYVFIYVDAKPKNGI